MEWSDKFLIGIDEIDKQHKQLVAIIANFQNKFKDNQAAQESYIEDIMGKTIQFLVRYTNYHFEMEEEYMRTMMFPDLPDHRRQHRNLVEQLKEVLIRLKTEKSYKPIEFYYFVTKWVSEHLLDADEKFGKYYLEKIKPNEPDKVIAQNPEDIISFFEEKFFKLKSLLKNELINDIDKKKKQFEYLNSFYSKLEIRKKENLYLIFESIDILVNKDYINSDDYKIITANLKESIDITKILEPLEDSQEKLTVLKFLKDRELVENGEYENYKSDILTEID